MVHANDTGSVVSVSCEVVPLTTTTTPSPLLTHCTAGGVSMIATGADWKKKPYVLKWQMFTTYFRVTGS